jgi:hypothetical protein
MGNFPASNSVSVNLPTSGIQPNPVEYEFPWGTIATIEGNLQESSLASPILFRVQYPAFLKPTPIIANGCQSVYEFVHCYEGVEVCRIGLDICTPKTKLSLHHRAREYADRIRQQGIHLTGAALIPYKPPTDFESACIFSPDARYNGHGFDCPLLMLQHVNAFVALCLFGPSREESPEWWAINKRAFEIVRDSLVIGEPEDGPPVSSSSVEPTSAPPRIQPRFPNAGSY